MDSIFLSIADFTLCLYNDDNFKIALEDGYLPFVTTDLSKHPDIVIRVNNAIPKDYLSEQHVLFEAKNSSQKFFSIHQQQESFKFIIYDQQAENKIQQIAFLDKEFKNWEIYADQDQNNNIIPLRYPLGPIILYYLTVKFNAIMIHASGISDGSKGRLFTGLSGTGKSTMAYLWQKEGSKIINDDRLIIRCEDDKYYIYNTPMFYIDIPKKELLHSIHLIHHAKENTVSKIEGATAISRVLAYCIQHNFNNKFIEHHLAFLNDLCKKIKIYEVGFIPDKTIVDLIKSLND